MWRRTPGPGRLELEGLDGGGDQRRVAAETGSPQIVAEDGGLRPVGLILLRQKSAAEGGRDAENLEEFSGDVYAFDLLRPIA